MAARPCTSTEAEVIVLGYFADEKVRGPLTCYCSSKADDAENPDRGSAAVTMQLDCHDGSFSPSAVQPEGGR